MRIMQINAVCANLSTGRTTKEFALSLQARGHETSVVYSEGVLDYSEGYHMKNRVDKKIHALCSRVTGLVGYFSKRETRKLLRYISEWRPDIVRLGNLHGNFIHIPLLLKFLSEKEIAVEVTLHDCFWFTGKCCHYTITGCYRWKGQCGKCPRVHRDNKSWFFDRTKKMLWEKKTYFNSMKKLAVIGVSKWVTEQAKQSLLSEASYVGHIYNWIDVGLFKYTPSDVRLTLGLKDKFIVLGVSSAWSFAKGLGDFIALAKELEEVVFVMLGKMNESDLPSNIISLPPTDSIGKLVEIYSMADVFFNPSIEETFGKVTAEALACGTPAIVYDTTGSPELIGENCGFVVELNDLEAVKNSIRNIMHKGKASYSQYCREFAVNNFEKEKNIEKRLNIYKKILMSEGMQ